MPGGRRRWRTLTPDDEELEEVSNEMLNRVDPSRLTLSGLVFLLQRCYQVSTFAGGRAAALRLIAIDDPGAASEDELLAAKMMAHTFMVQSGGASDEAVEHLEAGKALAATKGESPAGLLLLECGVRARRGEMQAFQGVVDQIVKNHGQDEQVMGRLQQMLIRMGILRPDGRPAGPPPSAAGPAAPAAGGSGLWTPGSGDAAPATQPAPAAAPARLPPAEAQSFGSREWIEHVPGFARRSGPRVLTLPRRGFATSRAI